MIFRFSFPVVCRASDELMRESKCTTMNKKSSPRVSGTPYVQFDPKAVSKAKGYYGEVCFLEISGFTHNPHHLILDSVIDPKG